MARKELILEIIHALQAVIDEVIARDCDTNKNLSQINIELFQIEKELIEDNYEKNEAAGKTYS